jgi:hypothetical protein
VKRSLLRAIRCCYCWTLFAHFRKYKTATSCHAVFILVLSSM